MTLPLLLLTSCVVLSAAAPDAAFAPPAEFRGDFGNYSPLLRFEDGREVARPSQWPERRREISEFWGQQLGAWPPLLKQPEIRTKSETNRENFLQREVELQISENQTAAGYLLLPKGEGPFPAVLVVYYEPETSVGLTTNKLRDFAYQLTKRGFVTLSIGSPGGDARKPTTDGFPTQPLSYLAYVSANCHTALARLPQVDAKRIGVVGHSYGGKWAMFSAALDERFAAAAWSDPGIVFDETRPNVNYWEPWYLGKDSQITRKPGAITASSPRTGAYKRLYESGHDLHEILALIAPRPFLVSGGSEDPPERWRALNRVNQVYHLLGATNRIAMTNRPKHDPTEQSNEQIYNFFERFLKQAPGATSR